MARVNVFCCFNAYGLGKDGHLISRLLGAAGHSVTESELVSPTLAFRGRRRLASMLSRRELYDLSIHIESCVPSLMHLSRKNVLIPNPEALRPETASHLREFDAIFCKTLEAVSSLTQMGLPVIYTGFSSHQPRVVQSRRNWHGFFHASGAHGSGVQSVKGSAALYRVWATNPQWPLLTMSGCEFQSRSNITCLPGFVAEKPYQAMQARLGIHLCLSEMEGFGHYIVEPMSIGCVVATTDGAPMNELVTSERGFLVPTVSSHRHLYGTRHVVADEAIEMTINRILELTAPQLQVLGSHARQWFEENDESFRRRFLDAVEHVLQD